MRRFFSRLVLGCLCALIMASFVGRVDATPTSTLWTNMTPDIQGFNVLHLGIDNYFTMFRKAKDGGGSFPTVFGLTMGVLNSQKLQMELGFDLLGATDDPLYFNAKLGYPEGALGTNSLALQIGMFNMGTHKGVTDQNLAFLVLGHTFKDFARFSVGPYHGNPDILRNSNGEKENTGFMAAFDHGFHPVKGPDGNTFNRFVFCGDYASGKNAIGGGGVGLYYFFTKDVSLLTGPVWFNDTGINGKWKLTTQLDVNF
ncbi:MAG: hypothetical protein HQM08_06270 [Candidatus Riflebacteria bacterium]|nr:hypothetical protein [Candidatus Riflebacteria bacterium]